MCTGTSNEITLRKDFNNELMTHNDECSALLKKAQTSTNFQTCLSSAIEVCGKNVRFLNISDNTKDIFKYLKIPESNYF